MYPFADAIVELPCMSLEDRDPRYIMYLRVT